MMMNKRSAASMASPKHEPWHPHTCPSSCRVEVWVEEGQSLGLSIVGGRHVIKRLRNGEELKGIFIKQVLPNSPADMTRCLKTGDKILEVGLTPQDGDASLMKC